MNIIEYNDAQATKELNEVKRYLMRIIQRYFDIENIYSKESVESIVVESLTRLKQDLLAHTDYIYNVNNEAGYVTLSIEKLEGEPAFEKHIAYNKDFGNTTDTILEGNDIRLSDEREPLEHIHNIGEVRLLQNRLDTFTNPAREIHANKNVLDMITYAGKQTEIDLAVLELLQSSIDRMHENLLYMQRESKSIYNKKLEEIAVYKKKIMEPVERAKLVVRNSITWLDNAKSYTNREITNLRNNFLFNGLMTKDQFASLVKSMNHTLRYVGEGDFNLSSNESLLLEQKETTEPFVSKDGDSLEEIFNNGTRTGEDEWSIADDSDSEVIKSEESEDETEQNDTERLNYNVHHDSYSMILSTSKFKNYTHQISVGSQSLYKNMIGVVIAYDDNTSDDLSLILSMSDMDSNLPKASVILNYTKYGYGEGYRIDPVDESLSYQLSDKEIHWTDIREMIVLIKRNNNNVKIWVKYAEQDIEEENNESVIITDEDEPIFDFNINEYVYLESFVNKEHRYGYGVFAQGDVFFKDLFFESVSGDLELCGTTQMIQESQSDFTMPSNLFNHLSNKRIKLWLKDGDKKYPLPFMAVRNGTRIIVQGTFDENHEIEINTHSDCTFNGLFTRDNIQNDCILIPIHAKEMSYEAVVKEITESGGTIATNKDKTFIKSLIKNNSFKYWIDNNGAPAVIDKSGNIQESSGEHGYVTKYKINRLTDLFDSPKIYYQVYGERED